MSWVAVGTAVAGAYAASQSGGGSAGVVSNRPFLRHEHRRAARDMRSALDDMNFVDFDPSFERGLEQQRITGESLEHPSRQLQPAERMVEAENLLGQTIRGDFLSPDSNPHMRDAIQAAQDPVMQRFNEEIVPGISSNAERAGAFGSARHGVGNALASREATRELGNISSSMLNSFYNQERGAQNNAMMNAPGFAGASLGMQLKPAEILQDVGAARRGLEQDREGFDVQREQMMINALSGLNAGGQQTHTAPQTPRSVRALQGGIGGAQLGMQVGQQFGGGQQQPSQFQTNQTIQGAGINPYYAG